MSKTVQVTDDNFQEEVIDSDMPVLVDFWAPWCGPCRQMGPVLEEIADELDGKLVVAKLNVDQNPATSRSYGIVSIPTMSVFMNGDLVKSFVGSRPKAQLKNDLEAFVK